MKHEYRTVWLDNPDWQHDLAGCAASGWRVVSAAKAQRPELGDGKTTPLRSYAYFLLMERLVQPSQEPAEPATKQEDDDATLTHLRECAAMLALVLARCPEAQAVPHVASVLGDANAFLLTRMNL